MVTPAFVIHKMCRKRAALLASLRIFHTLSCSGLSGTTASLFDAIQAHALWIIKTLDGILIRIEADTFRCCSICSASYCTLVCM